MSTTASISYLGANGIIHGITCHWDGYPLGPGVGRILYNTYDTLDKVKELIKLGDLSSLGTRLAPSDGEAHTFDKPAPNVCVAYHRDRKEDWRNVLPLELPEKAYYKLRQENYDYLFDKGKWIVRCNGGKWRKLSDYVS